MSLHTNRHQDMDQLFLVDHPLDNQYSGQPATHAHNSTYTVESRLETPIPPLHVQQKFLDDTNKVISNVSESNEYLQSVCSRCKKDFEQPIVIPKTNVKSETDENLAKPLMEPKIFKLCQHCRELQRQRSRRWQKKTKEKFGVCRRCGSDIPPELQKFVLCLTCRQNLRFRKANRAKQGRCVHCSGPLDTSILSSSGEENQNDNEDSNKPGQKNFKVCQRCRENDKIRRNNLEKLGNCNRCAKPLNSEDIGKHKVCIGCRSKKKKSMSSTMLGSESLQSNLNYNLDVANNVSNSSGPAVVSANAPISLTNANVPQAQNVVVNQGQNQEFTDHLLHFNSYPIQQQLNQALQPSNPVQINQVPNYNYNLGQMLVVQNQLMGQAAGQVGQIGQIAQMNQVGQMPLHQIPIQHPIMVNQLGQLSQINNQMFHPMNQQTVNMMSHAAQNQINTNGQGQKVSPNQQNLPMNNLQMNNLSYQY